MDNSQIETTSKRKLANSRPAQVSSAPGGSRQKGPHPLDPAESTRTAPFALSASLVVGVVLIPTRLKLKLTLGLGAFPGADQIGPDPAAAALQLPTASPLEAGSSAGRVPAQGGRCHDEALVGWASLLEIPEGVHLVRAAPAPSRLFWGQRLPVAAGESADPHPIASRQQDLVSALPFSHPEGTPQEADGVLALSLADHWICHG